MHAYGLLWKPRLEALVAETAAAGAPVTAGIRSVLQHELQLKGLHTTAAMETLAG
jgi:hypothetical protein